MLAQRGAIEAHAGLALRDADPEALRLVVERSRQAGNDAFRRRKYPEAIRLYSQALAGAGPAGDAALFANRSAAHLGGGEYEAAAADAERAAALRPDWAKAWYRLGAALGALCRWPEAAAALGRAVELDPSAADAAARLADARARAAGEAAARAAAAATARRGLLLRLRAARLEDRKRAALTQFKQAMAAPDWEPADLEWRPTWLPGMRLQPADAGAASGAGDPRRALLLRYLRSLADLAAPAAALRALADAPRQAALAAGLRAALAARPGAHVLAVSAGGGALALAAAAAGAPRVTAVERGRMSYRLAKQVLAANAGAPGAGNVRLLDRPLAAVRVAAGAGAAAAPAPAGSAAASAASEEESLEEVFDEAALAVAGALPRRADVLTIDLLDHAALGAGLLRAVDAAGARLLARGAAVVPRALRVRAQLLELKLPGSVAGFDLSALDQYRWYPGEERAALSSLPHRPLSAPFDVCALDLEARAARAFDAAAERRAARAAAAAAEDVEGGAEGAAAAADGSDADDAEADAGWEEDLELEIPVTAAGRWNAVAFWFDLDLGGGFAGARALTSYAPCGGASGAVLNSNEALPEAASPAASAFTSAAAEATSFGQAVQYLDGQAVEPSTTVALRARRDRGQLVFAGEPPPARPRHAAVPRWHYDMVLDAERNGAYDAAIRRAVARKRGSGFGSASTAAGPYVLDIGAGSGLLSMMAARAGAGAVAAAEVSPHMADVAEECVLANGFLGRITVLDRDARRLGVGPGLKPDGQAAELERRADVAVFEVFDSGLIGEGVLHCLAAAKARLLEPNAVLVPEAAAVFAQPIQLDRFDTLELGVAGAGVGAGAGAAVSASASSSKVASATAINVSAANAWRWRPDYEGVDLRGRRGEWLPLTAAPAPAFEFDFYAAEANMAPAERRIELTFTAPGVFNAVAFWFDLRLDAEASLTTSPYAPAGPTWQQAVQWVPEVTVQPGDTLVLTARHDTYGISFEVEADKNGGAAALATRQTGVPLVDAGWRAAHDELAGVNAQLARAVAQDPLEYRAVAAAAVAFAARPGEHGLEAAGAAEFAVKMMG